MKAARHGSLTAGTVATVNLGVDAISVEVVNRGGADEIYFTVDGPDPVIGGNDTYVLPAGVSSRIVDSTEPTPGNTTVRLICAVANTYSITEV